MGQHSHPHHTYWFIKDQMLWLRVKANNGQYLALVSEHRYEKKCVDVQDVITDMSHEIQTDSSGKICDSKSATIL